MTPRHGKIHAVSAAASGSAADAAVPAGAGGAQVVSREALRLGELIGWIDGIAEQARADDALRALGPLRAVAALRAYLRRGAQCIAQPRCFAVAMLARIAGARALAVLRETLREPPWSSLPPLSDAEYVVKNDVVDALAARDYAGFADDVAFGIATRLPAALRAAGRHGLAGFAAPIAALLDDDVLAAPARDALMAFGDAALDAVTASVEAALDAPAASVRTRLAALRGLQLLAELDPEARRTAHVMRHALCAGHPLLRAAAALPLARGGEADEAEVDALVRGAVGIDATLAAACRSALAGLPADAKRAAAVTVLARDAEPDLYGNLHRLDAGARRWLARLADANADRGGDAPGREARR